MIVYVLLALMLIQDIRYETTYYRFKLSCCITFYHFSHFVSYNNSHILPLMVVNLTTNMTIILCLMADLIINLAIIIISDDWSYYDHIQLSQLSPWSWQFQLSLYNHIHFREWSKTNKVSWFFITLSDKPLWNHFKYVILVL